MAEESSIESILRSYGRLSSDALQRLQASTFSFQGDLDFIDRELCRLQRQRQVIKTGLLIRRSRMEPIQCLPPEIISEIMLWTCIRGKEIEIASNRDQLHLFRVCKRWHDVAMSTPAFWSRLCLNIGIRLIKKHEIHWIEKWLKRSGKCAIDLHIRDTTYDDSMESSDSGSEVEEIRIINHTLATKRWHRSTGLIIEKLRLHIARCTRIILFLPTHYINQLFFPQRKGLRNLEYLSIDRPDMDAGCTILIDFLASPRLTELHCCSPGIHFKFLGEGDAVREIQTKMTQPVVLCLLIHCPYITRCNLTITEGMIFDDEPMVELLSLVELNITLFTAVELSEFGTLLDRLFLPSLRILTMKQEWSTSRTHENRSQIWPHLTDLLLRSHSPLLDLQIHPLYFRQTDLIEALSCIPTLRSLSISEFIPKYTFWRALTMTNDTASSSDHLQSLCSELTTLEIIGCTRISAMNVADMVMSRCSDENRKATSCKPLSSLHLTGVEEGYDVIRYPGMKACMDGGLDMEVVAFQRSRPKPAYRRRISVSINVTN